jgi:hypothetical protein
VSPRLSRVAGARFTQQWPWARGEPALVADRAREGLHDGVAVHEHHVVRPASRTGLAIEGILHRRSRRFRLRVRDRRITRQRLRVRRRVRVPELAHGAVGLGDMLSRARRARADWQLVLPPDPAAVQRRHFGSHDTHFDSPRWVFPDSCRQTGHQMPPICVARVSALRNAGSDGRGMAQSGIGSAGRPRDRSGPHGDYSSGVAEHVSRELNWANIPSGFGDQIQTCLS